MELKALLQSVGAAIAQVGATLEQLADRARNVFGTTFSEAELDVPEEDVDLAEHRLTAPR
jgi:hypothetical protein